MQARRISAPLCALESFSNAQSDGCVRVRWTRKVCTVGKRETWKHGQRSRNPPSHAIQREEMRRERTRLQDAFDERRRPTRPMRASLHVLPPVPSSRVPSRTQCPPSYTPLRVLVPYPISPRTSSKSPSIVPYGWRTPRGGGGRSSFVLWSFST